jgi:hypothetical protein
MLSAGRAKGTRCSTLAFMRSAGTIQVFSRKFISDHRAPSTSPVLQTGQKTPVDNDFQDTNGYAVQRYSNKRIRNRGMEQDGMAVSRKGIPDESCRLAPRKASARSRVSNGADILPDVDGRSAVASSLSD